MKTFSFKLQTPEGKQYTYEGTLESLYKHLQANEGVSVIEGETRFNELKGIIVIEGKPQFNH